MDTGYDWWIIMRANKFILLLVISSFCLSVVRIKSQTQTNDFYIDHISVTNTNSGYYVLMIDIWKDGVCKDYSVCPQAQNDFFKNAGKGLEIDILISYLSSDNAVMNMTLKNNDGSVPGVSCVACVFTKLNANVNTQIIQIVTARHSIYTYNPSENKFNDFLITPQTIITSTQRIDLTNYSQVFFFLLIVIITSIGMGVIVNNTRKPPKEVYVEKPQEKYEQEMQKLRIERDDIGIEVIGLKNQLSIKEEQLDHEKELLDESISENKRISLEKKILERKINEKLNTQQYICLICKTTTREGQEITECPHCQAVFHKDHLEEWIKIKGICPNCNKNL